MSEPLPEKDEFEDIKDMKINSNWKKMLFVTIAVMIAAVLLMIAAGILRSGVAAEYVEYVSAQAEFEEKEIDDII